MSDDIVTGLRARAGWFKRIPVGATTRIESDFAEDLADVLEFVADEIERLRARVEEFEKIVENYDRDRIEYCDAWMKWIGDHAALDIMEWMMAYANAIPAPNPDGKSPVEIYAAIDARSREAAMEIERLRIRVAELEDTLAGRRPVL